MTCVIGLQADGKVYMAGDSMSLAGHGATVRRDAKVFTSREYLIGFAGSYRAGQIVRYMSDLPHLPRGLRDVEGFLVRQFVPAVRGALLAHGFGDLDSCPPLLVGVGDVLFNIDVDYQLCRPLDDYLAIGSGGEVALGVMHATNRDALAPAYRLTMALEASAHHCAGVAAPFLVLST